MNVIDSDRTNSSKDIDPQFIWSKIDVQITFWQRDNADLSTLVSNPLPESLYIEIPRCHQ